jgi:chromosome segregation ATPase
MSTSDELARCYAELDDVRERLAAARKDAAGEQGRADRLQDERDKLAAELAAVQGEKEEMARRWDSQRAHARDLAAERDKLQTQLMLTRVKMHETRAALDFATNGEGRQLVDAISERDKLAAEVKALGKALGAEQSRRVDLAAEVASMCEKCSFAAGYAKALWDVRAEFQLSDRHVGPGARDAVDRLEARAKERG